MSDYSQPYLVFRIVLQAMARRPTSRRAVHYQQFSLTSWLLGRACLCWDRYVPRRVTEFLLKNQYVSFALGGVSSVVFTVLGMFFLYVSHRSLNGLFVMLYLMSLLVSSGFVLRGAALRSGIYYDEELPARQLGYVRPARWHRRTLERIPTTATEDISEDQLEELSDVTCAVCLCALDEGLIDAGGESACTKHACRIWRLQCGHLFHEACVKTWLWRNHRCPVCRTTIFTAVAMQVQKFVPHAATVEGECHQPPLAVDDVEMVTGMA